MFLPHSNSDKVIMLRSKEVLFVPSFSLPSLYRHRIDLCSTSNACVNAHWISDGSGVLTTHRNGQVMYHSNSSSNQLSLASTWTKPQSITASGVSHSSSLLISSKGMPLQMYELPTSQCDDPELSDKTKALPAASCSYDTSFSTKNDEYDPIFAIYIDSNVSNQFFTGAKRARVDLFDTSCKSSLATWQPSSYRSKHKGYVSSLCANNNSLYIGTSSGSFLHVDKRISTMDFLWKGATTGFSSLEQSENGNYIYMTPNTFHNESQNIKVWDVRMDSMINELNIPFPATSNEESLSQVGRSKGCLSLIHGLMLGSPWSASELFVWDRSLIETGGIDRFGKLHSQPTSTIICKDTLYQENCDSVYTNIVQTNPVDFNNCFISYTTKNYRNNNIHNFGKDLDNKVGSITI